MATEQARSAQAAGERTVERGPRGIGTGVAFDWALAAQILIMAPFIALGVGPGALAAGMPPTVRVGAVIASVVAAMICGGIGEALRRGNRYAWLFQIGFNALLFLDGFFGLSGAFDELRQQGHVSGLVRSVVLLIISPLIVFLLTRPQTRAWIARVTPAEAMARHGGRWIAFVALWSVIGGALIAFQGFY